MACLLNQKIWRTINEKEIYYRCSYDRISTSVNRALNAGFDDSHAMAVALEKYKIFHGVYRQKEEDEDDG